MSRFCDFSLSYLKTSITFRKWEMCFSGFITTLRQAPSSVRNSDPNSELVRTHNAKEPEQDSEMGRRKSKRKPPPKNRATEPLDTLFNCPFCNHEKSCEVKMEKTKNTGNIRCMVCMEDFQAGSSRSRVTKLSPKHT